MRAAPRVRPMGLRHGARLALLVPVVLLGPSGCRRTEITDFTPAAVIQTTPAPQRVPFEVSTAPAPFLSSLGFEFGEPGPGQLQKLYYVPAGKATLYTQIVKDLFPETPVVKPFTDFLRDPQNPPNPQVPGSGGGCDLIVIRDTRARVEQIEEFLSTLETSIPQVEVEALIVERIQGSEFQLGSTTSITEQDGDPDTLFDNLSGSFNTRAFLDSLLPGNLGGFQGGVVNLGTVHDETIINSVVEALASDELTEIISTPKLRVMSGFKASIITGQETPVQNVQVINNVSVVTTVFKETGTSLEIVPIVVGENSIRMVVKPEVSIVTAFTDPATTGGVSNPIISTRNAEASVMMRSGDTLVLGGLDSTQEVEAQSRIPVLGAIPILGHLFFSSTRKEKVKTRLLFFIKVKIASAGGPESDAILMPTPDPAAE